MCHVSFLFSMLHYVKCWHLMVSSFMLTYLCLILCQQLCNSQIFTSGRQFSVSLALVLARAQETIFLFCIRFEGLYLFISLGLSS